MAAGGLRRDSEIAESDVGEGASAMYICKVCPRDMFPPPLTSPLEASARYIREIHAQGASTKRTSSDEWQ